MITIQDAVNHVAFTVWRSALPVEDIAEKAGVTTAELARALDADHPEKIKIEHLVRIAWAVGLTLDFSLVPRSEPAAPIATADATEVSDV